MNVSDINVFIDTKFYEFRVSAEDAKEVLCLYEKLHVVTMEVKDINDAIESSIRWQISIWDALILTSAKKAGCSVVYTEDLNDGQKYGTIKVVNPFALPKQMTLE